METGFIVEGDRVICIRETKRNRYMKEEFVYEGWMGGEAQKFFEGNRITEERDGCATVGSFIRLSNGKTHLPSKGDKFTKHEDGSITVESLHR
jgi:hypothetical protein